MAIYGQMTRKNPAPEEEDADVTPDKLDQVTAEASSDLEQVLSHLSESIDDLTSNKPHPSPPVSRPSEPPHFTLASSPTDRRGADLPREPQ